jgi:hypothetical protein
VGGTVAVWFYARRERAVADADPIAVTDRLGSYDWIAATSRQICWSHLRRDFQAMIDRGGAAEASVGGCCGCRTGCSGGGIASRTKSWIEGDSARRWPG